MDNFNKRTQMAVINLVLYRRYINYVSVCPPLFGTLYIYNIICMVATGQGNSRSGNFVLYLLLLLFTIVTCTKH